MALTKNQHRVLTDSLIRSGVTPTRANARAIREVALKFTSKEIRTANPPSSDLLGQTIVSITIDREEYKNRIDWSRAWFDHYQQNIRKGRSVLGTQFPLELLTTDNIVTAENLSLTWALTTSGLVSDETAQTPRAQLITTEVVQTSAAAQQIESLIVDTATGNLIYRWSDGREQVAGYVAGPAPEISIGSVTTRPSGSGSSVTIEGTGPDYVLNFELETGPYQEGAVLETQEYTDPQWLHITTLGTLSLTEAVTEPLQATTKAYVDNLALRQTAFTIVFGS